MERMNDWRHTVAIIVILPYSGGEAKDQFWQVVLQCTSHLPPSKPRYCMGVGFAVDLVVCCALGADMYDCVFPTRTAVSEPIPLLRKC